MGTTLVFANTRSLAERLNLTLEIDEAAIRAAGINLEQRITLEVKDAPLEKLLEAALPNGLKWRLQGGRLEISPVK